MLSPRLEYDLWSFQDWSMLSPAFPKGKRGSKILLTTRNKEVASQADPWSLQLEPEPLNEEESWELLCKKAFPKATRDTNSYPADLEKLGRDMVRKCGGLPLAICALGGILATKREDIKEWKYVHRDVASNINGGVMGILALSYSDLPVHLKPCFLYLGLFPEDYAIPRRKLIRLWIAEGFIPHTEENAQGTLEEAGKRQYYGELIQRCMIQADKDTTPGEGKTCRMHDLMRDLCLSKGKELNFLDIHNHRIDGTTLNSSILMVNRCLASTFISIIQLQHFVLFSSYTHFSKPIVPLIKYNHIKLLRVLDLGGVYLYKNKIELIFELILEIGGLDFHKWDLLRQNKISSSIGNLRNLQTLKLYRGLSLETIALPETMENLVQLRHLEAGYKCKISGNLHIENLINLQTLVRVEAGKWIRKGCFGKLSKLQNLSISDISRSQADVLIHEISNMKSSSSSSFDENPIRVLKISSDDCFDNKIFDSLSCCNNLHRLRLIGRLDGGLNLQKYPPNLSKLILGLSRLEKDPMETLQYLPNLKLLELFMAFKGEEMACSAKGFPQLQVLKLNWMTRLKKWTIDQGGMPCLKELELGGLKELSMLPEGLRFITTLKKLKIESNMETIARRVVKSSIYPHL